MFISLEIFDKNFQHSVRSIMDSKKNVFISHDSIQLVSNSQGLTSAMLGEGGGGGGGGGGGVGGEALGTRLGLSMRLGCIERDAVTGFTLVCLVFFIHLFDFAQYLFI
jgi:hypothetical protein